MVRTHFYSVCFSTFLSITQMEARPVPISENLIIGGDSMDMFSRKLVGLPRSSLSLQQTRGAVCTNIRFVQRSSQESARVTERYREKLEKKAKEVGAKNIDDLKEKLKPTIEQKRQELNKIDPLKELEEYERKLSIKAQETLKQKTDGVRDPRRPTVPKEPFKTLNSFIDVEKISQLPAKEIEYIWRARFQNKDGVLISVISTEVFDKLYKNARENPSFVLPLPREGDGFELHYIQWSFVGPNTVHCMFTSLLEYKTHKEYARPHTSLMFHTELAKDKDLVLMNGVVEKDAPVSLQDAQLLLLNVQRFYGALAESEISKRRLQLLKDFTSGSPGFSVDELIKLAESLEV